MVRTIIFLFAAVMSLACGQKTETDPQEETRSGEVSETVVSLSTRTGFVTYGHEVRTFRPCASQDLYWIVDRTGSLQEIHGALTSEGGPYEELFAVLDLRTGPAPDEGFGAVHTGQVEIEFVDYVRMEGFGCDYDWGAFDFRAFGNEPFWSADVTDGIAILQRAGKQTLHWDDIEGETRPGVVKFLSTDGSLEILLTAEPCQDSMSGSFFGYSAFLQVDELELRGCAFHGTGL